MIIVNTVNIDRDRYVYIYVYRMHALVNGMRALVKVMRVRVNGTCMYVYELCTCGRGMRACKHSWLTSLSDKELALQWTGLTLTLVRSTSLLREIYMWVCAKFINTRPIKRFILLLICWSLAESFLFACDICDYKVMENFHLHNHKLIHSGL